MAEQRGWQCGKSRDERHRYMLENKLYTDVTFKFVSDDGVKELAAHKYMLMSMSPVFEAMFSGQFQEKDGIVKIVDISIDVFTEVINYMYYGDASVTGKNVLHIHYAANKYLLDDLVTICEHFVDSQLSTDNICTILDQSIMYDKPEIMQECVRLWENNTAKIIKSGAFQSISNQCLKELLTTDNPLSANELDIANACITWANCQPANPTTDTDQVPRRCTRDILGECLYLIRFTQISATGLATLIDKNPDLLTSDEQAHVLRYLIGPNERRMAAIESLGFRTIERIDKARPRGKIHFQVDNIHDLKRGVQLYSSVCYIGGAPWRLMVRRKKIDNEDNLGVFLSCDVERYMDVPIMTWSIFTECTLNLLAKRKVKPLTQELKHIFYHVEPDWGFEKFTTYDTLIDETYGIIRDDGGITLEAHVRVIKKLKIKQ